MCMWCMTCAFVFVMDVSCVILGKINYYYHYHHFVASASYRVYPWNTWTIMLCLFCLSCIVSSLWIVCFIHPYSSGLLHWHSDWINANRPIPQIPQCIRHVSHNAPLCNRNVHVCTFLLQRGSMWDMGQVHCGVWDWCIVGLWIWSIDLWHKSHNAPVPFPTMHYVILLQACAFLLQNDALWDMGLVHCGFWSDCQWFG